MDSFSVNTTTTMVQLPFTAAALSAKFPSLASPLSSPVPILGLYFAASWCPDCAPVTPKIQHIYQSQTTTSNKLLNLLYISSDTDEPQMRRSIGDSLPCVPFDNFEEREELKRHFGTCAAKERTFLGLLPAERKHGIPTLILLESASGRILTEDGIDDLMQQQSQDGADVLEMWKSLLSSPSTKN
jgi:nucleoredoxin